MLSQVLHTMEIGGGFGGPNNVPIHTDATNLGPWETFSLEVIK
jgi:hypothetical protein